MILLCKYVDTCYTNSNNKLIISYDIFVDNGQKHLYSYHIWHSFREGAMTHTELDRYIHEELNINWFPRRPEDPRHYLSEHTTPVGDNVPFWNYAAFRWTQPSKNLLIFPNPQTDAPPHTHTYFEMMYVYEGEVVHGFDGERVVVPQDAAIIIPPGVRHSLEDSPDAISFNVILPRELLQGGLMERLRHLPTLAACFGETMAFPTGLLLPADQGGKAGHFFRELLCQTYDPDAFAGQTIELLLPLLFTELERAGGSVAPARSQHGIEDDINRVLQYIDANSATATLAEAATRFGYTSGYISKALKRATGQSFSQLRQERCILRAAVLLLAEPGRSVTSIADEVGIGNITQFYRLFDQQFHMTPKAYRQERREEEA